MHCIIFSSILGIFLLDANITLMPVLLSCHTHTYTYTKCDNKNSPVIAKCLLVENYSCRERESVCVNCINREGLCYNRGDGGNINRIK